jgi:hypothetical protein
MAGLSLVGFEKGVAAAGRDEHENEVFSIMQLRAAFL